MRAGSMSTTTLNWRYVPSHKRPMPVTTVSQSWGAIRSYLLDIAFETDAVTQDELAENQIADPGYSGTQYDIDLQGFDFDLFSYYDDVEYGDDTYWDYFALGAVTGEKRKRNTPAQAQSKRRKTPTTPSATSEGNEPTLFRSREERNRAQRQLAPPVSKTGSYAFMGDWRKRFANEDGIVNGVMPAAMRMAAEGHSQDTPQKPVRAEVGEDDELGDAWEDEDEGEAEAGAEGGFAIDPEMLKTILKQKLGDAGLDGMDEGAFMDTIKRMLSGEGDGEEAAGSLANSLLGQVTSDTGNEALSGWLSQQGVSFQDNGDDDASSVATTEDSSRHASVSQQRKPGSPPDSAVSGIDIHKAGHSSQQTVSPVQSNKKKRMATRQDSEQPKKKSKAVSFEDPSDSDAGPQEASRSNRTVVDDADGPRSTAAKSVMKVTKSIGEIADTTAVASTSSKATRKRKATSAEALDDKPPEKKTKNRELQALDATSVTASPGPPARRTRAARAKKDEK